MAYENGHFGEAVVKTRLGAVDETQVKVGLGRECTEAAGAQVLNIGDVETRVI